MKKNAIKPHIVKVGPSPAIATLVQRELEERGVECRYSLSSLTTGYGENAHVGVNGGNQPCTGTYEWCRGERKGIPLFDLTTQPIPKWLAFLDEPEKSIIHVKDSSHTEVTNQGYVILNTRSGCKYIGISEDEIDALYAASQAARGIEPAKPAEFDKVAYLESLRNDYRQSPLGFNDFIGQRLAVEKAKQEAGK